MGDAPGDDRRDDARPTKRPEPADSSAAAGGAGSSASPQPAIRCRCTACYGLPRGIVAERATISAHERPHSLALAWLGASSCRPAPWRYSARRLALGCARLTPDSRGRLAGFGRAKRCILVYLLGGPPQIDMWDLKPTRRPRFAGRSSRSPPRCRACILRAFAAAGRRARRPGDAAVVTFPNNDHPVMIYHTLTGRSRACRWVPTRCCRRRRRRSAHGLGGGAVQARNVRRARLRGHARGPRADDAAPVSGGGRAGFLGAAYDPWRSTTIPRNRRRLRSCLRVCRRAVRRAAVAAGGARRPCAAAQPTTRDYQTFRESAVQLIGAAAGGGLFASARTARDCASVRPASLRSEPAAGPPAGRARRVVRRRALQLHDQMRRLGHAQAKLPCAEGRAAAAVGPGAVGAARRSARAGHARRDAGRDDGRVRPHAARSTTTAAAITGATAPACCSPAAASAAAT